MSNEQPDAADTSRRPKWTVMIYMAGDNNLTEECIYSLTEMKKVDLGQDVQVFVQYDPKDDFLPVKRYQINRKPNSSLKDDEIDSVQQDQFQYESPRMKPYRRFTNDQKERAGEGFSGDPAALFNFIAYCLDPPPLAPVRPPRSERYFLIVCGHGAGIQRDYLLKDESPEGYLTLKELGSVFRSVHQDFVDEKGRHFVFDTFGMDTCLMSMAEIAFEVRGSVQVTIGCPSYAPASGWPYKEVLELIKSSCATTSGDCLRALAKQIVDQYVGFYADYSQGGLSVTQSALDVRLVNQLIDGRPAMEGTPAMTGLRELADLFKDKLEDELDLFLKKRKEVADFRPPSHSAFTSALILAHWEAQSYNGELYVDVADFLHLLAQRLRLTANPKPEISDLARQCDELADFIEKRFVIASRFSGRKFQWTSGLSIYFPWDHVLPYYADAIEFPKHSRWVDFLQKSTLATRRPPRPGYGKDFDKLVDQNFTEIRMGPDKMGPDKSGGNPIHSMRNPPITVATGKHGPTVKAEEEPAKPSRVRRSQSKPAKRGKKR